MEPAHAAQWRDTRLPCLFHEGQLYQREDGPVQRAQHPVHSARSRSVMCCVGLGGVVVGNAGAGL
ncbi:hypothetical protein E2C01_095734 [Portunus trituberculatus]|uniref:Uncharacterized protein n=1 Tax=Portunus trituberculatus TaxID=210409 RepID=A0A5B7K0X5_PORTR|nr:hypothetical protein [Portunus trituberculatus]